MERIRNYDQISEDEDIIAAFLREACRRSVEHHFPPNQRRLKGIRLFCWLDVGATEKGKGNMINLRVSISKQTFMLKRVEARVEAAQMNSKDSGLKSRATIFVCNPKRCIESSGTHQI